MTEQEYTDILQNILKDCNFKYSLNGAIIKLNSEDLKKLSFDSYMGNILGWCNEQGEIRISLNKENGEPRKLQTVVHTFLHELAHLLEFKAGWFKTHRKSHGKQFYDIHSYIVETYNNTYNDVLSRKVAKQFQLEIESLETQKNIRKQYNAIQRNKTKAAREKYKSLNTKEIFEIMIPYIKQGYRSHIVFTNFEFDIDNNTVTLTYFHKTLLGYATFTNIPVDQIIQLQELITI